MSLGRGEQKVVLPFKVSLESFSEEVTWEPRPKPRIWYDLQTQGQARLSGGSAHSVKGDVQKSQGQVHQGLVCVRVVAVGGRG